jgi:formate C-acetyltransferase
MLKFGIGQSGGNDRNGLTALLSSVAKCDKHRIMYGSSVTNLFIDEQMVRNDESFDKLTKVLETYFYMGGTHFQLSYVSKEDLKNAKINPEDYKSLRVRVSGFSDYFVKLTESIQDDIIERTVLR